MVAQGQRYYSISRAFRTTAPKRRAFSKVGPLHKIKTHAPLGRDLTVFPDGPVEAGKGGEGGVLQITNAEFVAAVSPSMPAGAFVAVCSKGGDPDIGGWPAHRFDPTTGGGPAENNNYIGCSTFYPGEDGSFRARKAQFSACHFLMLDDLGTKVPLDRLGGFELSWLIETSPGNHQAGIILAAPLTDGAVAVRLLNAVIDAGLCDAGAAGPLSRWARLPVGINGKHKHAGEDGAAFKCRLLEWQPQNRYTPEEIVDGLQLGLAPAGRPKKTAKPAASSNGASHGIANDADDVLTPKAAENPVVAALKARGLYKTPLGSGKHDMRCPWVQEHTDELDTGAAYFEPDELYPVGGFCCQHSPLCQRSCRSDRIKTSGGAGRRTWLGMDRRLRTTRWRDCCRRRVAR